MSPEGIIVPRELKRKAFFSFNNKLIVTIRKYRFKIFVAVVKFCCVRLKTGFGAFCILELVMSIWTF